MHDSTSPSRPGALLILGLWLLAASAPALAEKGTVKVLAPWNSIGQAFPIAPDKVLFQGRGEGIMYIENGEKETLNAALFVCPGNTVIDLSKGSASRAGHCVITPAGGSGDTVFAEFQCKGEPGSCKGKFEITGGTGAFEGITGSGEVLIQTVVADLAQNAKTGAVIKGATGLAIWPKLKYSIPGKGRK